ncbi:hypothetical protein BKA67DRAFT_547413 [Truncatella angustata]|uniref:NADPH-dependent 1-acyldihydroxyacetone phosphate reductase n=1 Tax=Truncatella angustata TaxID=152316 RepID=A0A9P8UXB3_9PEZI|nr:uncharacterized protein BKA67DRAFT_547413 [Truncatella angustata]KAH6660251.1 hypothetical protein BKA67DRAFT_547413 [Truncatella angustata]KAH8202647.1 hypothetical protein TruAng_003133 [Truncatella angustata]
MQKVVLITGCSDGSAGAALARQFQLRGCHVFAAARKLEKMQRLADLGICTLAMDVLSKEQINAAVDIVRDAAGGKLDVLINNAAGFNLMTLADQNLEDARAMFDVNVFGLLAVTQAFLPLLVAAGGNAVIANVSSISVVAEPAFQGIYAATKAAVFTMSGVMRKEFSPFGVKVVTIMSGGVNTNFMENKPWKVPKESWYFELAGDVEGKKSTDGTGSMKPDEYAKRVVGDLLCSNPGPVIFRGKFATAVWILTWLGWYGMLDSTEIKNTKLDILRPRS